MVSPFLCLLLVLTIWIYLLWSRRKYYKLMLQIPGPIGYPILGILPGFFKQAALTRIIAEGKNYGTNVFTWFGPSPLLITYDPQTTQDVLNSPATLNKSYIVYGVMDKFIGNGLILLKDLIWAKHRKAINPLFHPKTLQYAVPIFNKESNCLIKELGSLVGTGEHDLILRLKNFSLGISTQTIWGLDIKDDKQYQNLTMMKIYMKILEVGTKLVMEPWLDNKFLFRAFGFDKVVKVDKMIILNKIKQSVDRHIKEMKEDESKNTASETFVKIAIGQYKLNNFSYQDVVDETHTLTIAAFETTALSVEYFLMHMALHPEYQEKVYDEIKAAYPDKDDCDVKYEDLHNLEYLDLLIKESLRVMPSIPFMGRTVSQDLTLSNGIVIPKGVQVIICPFLIHRSKTAWGPEAERFNPNNCLPENLIDKHPYSYIPFSKGKRNCVGLKYGIYALKIALIKLMRNFKFTSSFRYEDIDYENNLALHLKNMPRFQIEHRT